MKIDNKNMNLDEIEEYRKLDEIKFELHDLLREIIIKTDCGYISDDYTELIEFELGDVNIISDNYYHNLKMEVDGLEIDLNHDLKTAENILEEIRKRNEEFETENSRKIKEEAEKIFKRNFKINRGS